MGRQMILEKNGSRYSPNSNCSQFMHACNSHLLMSLPNILTLSHFKRIYKLSQCCEFVLHAADETYGQARKDYKTQSE